MTKKRLSHCVCLVMSIYALVVLLGIYFGLSAEGEIYYGLFKDLTPFLLALPAAWLGYCFSRRLSFVGQLREQWFRIVDSIQAAYRYTEMEKPTFEQYSFVRNKLSCSIDEIRGSFKNIGENEFEVGLYPFEEFHEIHNIISSLGYEDSFDAKRASGCREKITPHWKKVRQAFLSEFDRPEPTFPSLRYLESG